MIVVATRPPAEADPPSSRRSAADLVEMGSAGAKTMAVVRGEADIYAHSGGQYEWDSAAPVAVAAAAGLPRQPASTDRRCVYNHADPYLPDLLVCRPELARPRSCEALR